MSLLGIDVGTTGCKVGCFSLRGELLASAYKEYGSIVEKPGQAELDSKRIWKLIKELIREAVQNVADDPVNALSVSSLGEAVVPVTRDRRILGTSILNFDMRGGEYIPELREAFNDEHLYRINGNTLGNHYSLTKLKWIKDKQPELYEHTDKFLHWASFVSFMLGAEPVVDYSLANRTLLFDLSRKDWSTELLQSADLDRDKLPPAVPSGVVIGRISKQTAKDLGLSPIVVIVSGTHDQCANAIGCGVIKPGSAVYGMGTFLCITPVFAGRRAPSLMIERGIYTEHHAVPEKYVCFIYNQGGSLVKWYRETFARPERQKVQSRSESVYSALFAEVPKGVSSVMVLPHFTTTGPPDFISNSCGLIAGLRLETTRGDILKGMIEGMTFYLREVIDSLPPTGIQIADYRPVGGGSKSDVWVQTSADIMGQPFTRPVITEAGTLGAAIIAGVGSGMFSSYHEGVDAMVKLERIFEPDGRWCERYTERYLKYRKLWPLMQDYLCDLTESLH